MERTRTQRLLGWLSGPIPTSVVLAFAIGALFIMAAGADPVSGYRSMFSGSFGSGLGLGNTLQRAVPLVGMAMAVAVAFRAGIINLGGEGQMILGGLAGGVVALQLPGLGALTTLIACVAGAAVGALWGAVPALLQLRPGVPLLITSLLLNYPAQYFSSWMVRFPLKDPTSSTVATETIAPEVRIPLVAAPSSDLGGALQGAFGSDGVVTIVARSVNWSLLVVAAIVVAIHIVNTRTRYGFESGLNGLNPRFTRYGGVPAASMTVRTMMLSGGIAGLVGAMYTIGAPTSRIIDGQLLDTNYAWTGLLVALLALYRPVWVAVAGLFFAAIVAGSATMGRDLSLSPQIASVIQGIVIVLIACRIRLPFRSRRTAGDVAATRGEHDQAEVEVGRV